jgi:hypothetical protein
MTPQAQEPGLMAAPRVTAAEFAATWGAEGGSPTAVAKAIGMTERGVYARRARLEAEGYQLPSRHIDKGDQLRRLFAYDPRVDASIEDGCAIIGGDRHIWPGDAVSMADAAMLTLIPQLRPKIIISNGDVFDGASLSRHAPLGHESKPRTDDEVMAVQAHLHRIAAAACGWQVQLMRTVGNHCMRFDRKLAETCSDMSKLHGMRLRDQIPAWSESWAIHINAGVQGGHTVVKHRQRSGVHASYNNATIAGVHIVTNHTHRQDVRAITNYNGTHYGVQTGMLADRHQPAHEYAEDHPDPGQPGFAVLTWKAGVLLPPELATVDDAGVCWFRGEPVRLRVRVKAGSSTHHASAVP